jgi:hypothetical protein
MASRHFLFQDCRTPTADVDDEGVGKDPGRAVSEAGLDVIRELESTLRDLGRGR